MLLALSSFDVIDVLLNERQWTRRQLADHLSALYRRVFVGAWSDRREHGDRAT
ncbi:hypothetical protein [Actinomadura sp. CNU-125]|uniref:hypothetical protein n=1 Tax=Actinomadura sp. CNU-125 TaxID=1904961 RepID=UPI0013013458|nr:hypothetical protein [Actinomadura sp. CNU-125]